MNEKVRIVCGYGINDTCYGWTADKINKIIYKRWRHVLMRVYDEKFHKKNPTYINCTLCLEWHYLSKFAEDFKKLDGYNEEKLLNGELELDKDIKSNGTNKEYSLENCMLVSKSENIKQSNKTREYECGENHPMYGKHHSDETKSKQSEIAKKRFLNKKNHPMYGKQRSKETREKVSKTRIENKISKGKNHPQAKRVAQYDLDGNLIKVWDYAKEISETLNLNYSSLLNHLNGTCKTNIYKGYIWKYI